MQRLTEERVPHCQQRGYFDEHLITLNAQVYGEAYIYEDTYLVYHDPLGKMLWLTLFALKDSDNQIDRLECVKASLTEFQPRQIRTASPEELPPAIADYCCENAFSDSDYQIKLDEFDENLRGGPYDSLRYRVKNAIKRGYTLNVGKEITPAHSYIMAYHISQKNYNLWDYQLYLRLQNYIIKSSTAKLFNVLREGVLIGFDVVDFLGNTMATPVGFYLDYPSLADFIIHKEIVYAKENKFEWLDIGWSCNQGLEEFKKKWKGIPRFKICVQEYFDKKLLETRRRKAPAHIALRTAHAQTSNQG
ncbi:MAG TPA: hypothetical protein VJ249_04385 [Candidatus Bathyarchaeia archaeon]|nr:hypothetical protein [Candidatus Bathyarchaeia archaeon]